MTIKAHLIKEINIKDRNEEIKIEKIIEKTPTFNLKSDTNILRLFQEISGDNLNNDLNGELYVDKTSWNTFLNSTKKDKFTSKELKIIKKITRDIENKEFILYECF